MQYSTIPYRKIQHNTIQYSAKQNNTIQNSKFQYNAIQCNTIQKYIQYNTEKYLIKQYNTIPTKTIQYNTINSIQFNTRYVDIRTLESPENCYSVKENQVPEALRNATQRRPQAGRMETKKIKPVKGI